MNKAKLKKITSARLFLPIVCLIAVLLINVIKTPDFFNITIRNGVLYGYVIDVINRASEHLSQQHPVGRISVLVQLWQLQQLYAVRSYPAVQLL